MSWTRTAGMAAAALVALLAGCAPRARGGLTEPSPRGGDDVVYLKDGRTLQGSIVEEIPDSSLSLRMRDGIVLVLQEAQIRRVRARSALRAGATWVPPARLPDSALVGRWVHIEAQGIGTRENRVVRIDADTLVMHRWFGTRKVPRAAIVNALVSTAASRQTARGAITVGLGEGLGMYLASRLMRATSSEATAAVAAGAGFGTLAGALFGYFKVEHEGWRRLDLKPGATVAPAARVRTGDAAGLRARDPAPPCRSGDPPAPRPARGR